MLSQAVTLTVTSCSATPRQQPRQKVKANTKMKRPKKKLSQSTSSVGFNTDMKEVTWHCVEGCGACCKLDKGPLFATPEEIFDNPSDIEMYRSLIGPDGWCVHFEKSTRKCSIYSDRPYFCRVEPEIFKNLYGIDEKRFHKEACSCCRDTIKAIYGSLSEEFSNFNKCIRSSSSG